MVGVAIGCRRRGCNERVRGCAGILGRHREHSHGTGLVDGSGGNSSGGTEDAHDVEYARPRLANHGQVCGARAVKTSGGYSGDEFGHRARLECRLGRPPRELTNEVALGCARRANDRRRVTLDGVHSVASSRLFGGYKDSHLNPYRPP